MSNPQHVLAHTHETNPHLAKRLSAIPKQVAEPPRVVLDIGGNAESNEGLGVLFPHSLVVSINLRSSTGYRERVVLGDACRLPFKRKSVDLAFAGEVLEHLLEPLRFLDEIHKVLADDGTLILTTPNLASWYNRLFLLMGQSPPAYSPIEGRRYGVPRWLRTRESPRHVTLFTRKGVEEVLAESGFRVISVTGFSGYFGFMERLRKLLSSLLPTNWQEDLIIVSKPWH